MKRKATIFCALLTVTLLSAFSAQSENLRAYYEQQKIEIVSTFQAPEPGTKLTIVLVSDGEIQGTLVKLTDTELTLMTPEGETLYPQTALTKSSRTKLFAADYADAEARKRTLLRKKELQTEVAANTHKGQITVSAKTETDIDSTKEKKKNKTTTTKTKSVVMELTITTRNKTSHTDTYQLEWFVFSRSVNDREITTHDSGVEEITVEAGKPLTHKIKAKPITEITVAKEDKKPQVSGDKKAGYLVLLKHGDTILNKQSNSKTFLTDAGIEKARNSKSTSSKRKKK